MTYSGDRGVFVDTNVFVYAVDNADPSKQKRARLVLETEGLTVSPQVMNEFYVISTRKLAQSLTRDEALKVIDGMARLRCVPIDADLVRSAIAMGGRWQLAHWDALMIAAAQRGGCDRILTEDMSTGAIYDGVRIENPFAVDT